MNAVSATLVRELREKTGAGMMDCKKALAESAGDMDQAVVFLRQRGLAAAAKRATRVAAEGVVGSYVHGGGKIGVLIEVNCETDFVARTPDFEELVKDLSMQVAASSPTFVAREDVSESVQERERGIYRVQAEQSGKPPAVIEKMVAGKMTKFFAEVCLLEQPFIKDAERTVGERIAEVIGRLGENIVVRRFVRFQVGEQVDESS